jgi:hypothetical protein
LFVPCSVWRVSDSKENNCQLSSGDFSVFRLGIRAIGSMRSKLISIFVGGVFIVAASGLAGAADMAVKAPPKPVAPPAVYSWTGFYVGANGGYGWKDPTVTFTPNDANEQLRRCLRRHVCATGVVWH